MSGRRFRADGLEEESEKLRRPFDELTDLVARYEAEGRKARKKVNNHQAEINGKRDRQAVSSDCMISRLDQHDGGDETNTYLDS